MSDQSVTVHVGDASLHVARRVAPDRPSLVLLHGITDGGAVWGRVADALTGDFDVVMPDARGHGLSSRLTDPPSVVQLAEDAAAVIEELDLAPALVWGHSMGALTAAVLASRRPELVAAVVLEDPPLVDSRLVEDADDGPVAEFLALLGRFPSLPPEERLAIARRDNPGWHPSEHGPWAETKAQLDLSVMTLMTEGMGVDWRVALGGVERPALLVTGDSSSGAIVDQATAAEAQALLRHGRVARIPGAGHSVHRDAFDAVVSAVVPFLRDHAPGRD